MQIIVEIRRGEDGRLAGSVRSAGQTAGRSFSGTLEFLSIVENLFTTQGNPDSSITDTSTSPKGERND
jgi:hypothetical protein